MCVRIHKPVGIGAAMAACNLAMPPGFLKLADALQQPLARRLGYFGNDRFVAFHYESRGHEVMWTDARSSGFGTGAWAAFFEIIEPVARREGIELGFAEERAKHVLVVDQESHDAYFAPRLDARRFLSEQCAVMPA